MNGRKLDAEKGHVNRKAHPSYSFSGRETPAPAVGEQGKIGTDRRGEEWKIYLQADSGTT